MKPSQTTELERLLSLSLPRRRRDYKRMAQLSAELEPRPSAAHIHFVPTMPNSWH